MTEITTVGIDADRAVVLWRNQLLEFYQQLGPCLAGMESCAGVHHQAREFFIRQLTQVTDAGPVRAQLGEFGIVTSKRGHNVDRMVAAAARVPLRLLADPFSKIRAKIDARIKYIRDEQDGEV